MWKPEKDGEGPSIVSGREGLLGHWRKKGTRASCDCLGTEVDMKNWGRGEGCGSWLAQSVSMLFLICGL